jgi:hypothetical protein
VGVLIHSGTLQPRHRAAADRWSADYEFGVHGGRDLEKKGSGGAGYDSLTIARLQTCNSYLDAKAAVGGAGDGILVSILFDRMSVTALAEARGEPVERVSGYVCAVMERLVEHYYDVDSVKRGRQRHTIAGSRAHQPPAAIAA